MCNSFNKLKPKDFIIITETATNAYVYNGNKEEKSFFENIVLKNNNNSVVYKKIKYNKPMIFLEKRKFNYFLLSSGLEENKNNDLIRKMCAYLFLYEDIVIIFDEIDLAFIKFKKLL